MRRFKHFFVIICCLAAAFMLASSAAALSPTPSATPNPSGMPEGGKLITLGDSGWIVYKIQQRLLDLNFFAFKATASYQGMTQSSVRRFQEFNGLMADGTVGAESLNALFSPEAKRGAIDAHIPIGSSSMTNENVVYGAPTPWSEVDALFTSGPSYEITDINSGKTLHVIRKGGINHAEVKLASSADNETFLSLFGGEENWSKRAVTVNISGTVYAASLQGTLSGKNTACLYFSGSTSEIGGIADEEHRLNVLKAAGM